MRRAKATTSDFIVTSYSPRQENTALRPYLPRFVHAALNISSRVARAEYAISRTLRLHFPTQQLFDKHQGGCKTYCDNCFVQIRSITNTRIVRICTGT